jgi:hypothetical protein
MQTYETDYRNTRYLFTHFLAPCNRFLNYDLVQYSEFVIAQEDHFYKILLCSVAAMPFTKLFVYYALITCINLRGRRYPKRGRS